MTLLRAVLLAKLTSKPRMRPVRYKPTISLGNSWWSGRRDPCRLHEANLRRSLVGRQCQYGTYVLWVHIDALGHSISSSPDARMARNVCGGNPTSESIIDYALLAEPLLPGAEAWDQSGPPLKFRRSCLTILSFRPSQAHAGHLAFPGLADFIHWRNESTTLMASRRHFWRNGCLTLMTHLA